ncbi:unnamed protein product [Schistosoma rodhaini]|uniref:Fork-head domain-containing protein n=2 Tax=Schistosoma rodhaini TaxID=6188 RepID=A0AA85FIY9_9TREM|nr:unnamed protein product [Schistosoma rodhaini]
MDKVHSHALYSYSDINKLSPLDVDMTVINNSDSDKSGVLLDTWSVKHSSDLVSTPNDLVSLAWLQKRDILQIAPLDGEDDGGDSVSSPVTGRPEDEDNFETNPILHMGSLEPVHRSPSLVPVSQFSVLDRCVRRPASVSGEQLSHSEQSRFSTNPTVALGTHGLTKPNYSYTHLIFMAIESTPQKCMTVNQIYNWCESNFPFYKHAGVGWKNSLRHNLSINKSFKRLPRDSRGPGRGAFWTVEPRERASLLDAIKRNPWNFASVTAMGCHLSDGSHNVTSASAYPVRRFGLAHSAPGHLLRAEGLGRDKLESTPQIRLLYTSDGKVLATYDASFIDPSKFEYDLTAGKENAAVLSSDVPLSDIRYWTSPSGDTTSTDGATAKVEWPAEEEEKYLDTLRLLNEGEEKVTESQSTITEPSDENSMSKAKSEALESFIGTHILDDAKLVTKQKRKSRLLPTRIRKCNECKENTSGCESCLAKRYEVLNSNYVRSALKEYDLDIGNMLDCDQEQGPAGGPLVKTITTRISKSASPVAEENESDVDSCDEKPANPETLIYSSDEVYVTPPPYIDHEYSHCQAQLRRPEENQLVNKFNDNYYTSRLSELMNLYPLLKAFVDSIVLETDANYEADEFDDGFSSSENDIYSEEDFDEENRELKDSGIQDLCDCEYTFCRRSSRRRHPVSPYYESRKTRSFRIPSRGVKQRKGTRSMKLSSLNSCPTRRSKRVIKAPRRPYDDFERSQYYNYELDDESRILIFDGREGNFGSSAQSNMMERYGRHSPNSQSDIDSESAEKSMDIENSRYRYQNHYQSLKRAHQPISGTQPHLDNIVGRSSPDLEDYDFSSDQEESYLRAASTLQVRKNGTTFSSSHPLSKRSQTKKQETHLDVADGWNSMKWPVGRKIDESSINGLRLGESHNGFSDDKRMIQRELSDKIQTYKETVEEPVLKRNKQTAVDAARLLLGFSQIQNLRQKSECVNLDTSVASSTLDFKRTSISNTDSATSESIILQEVPATLI